MTQVMTPSTKPITKGQAGKFVDVAVDALVKSGLPSDPTQQILETQGPALADEFVASVRKRVEVLTGIIVRRVKVDRSRTPQAMLDTAGRKQYTDRKVVDSMPGVTGTVAEEDVLFFKVGRYISDDDLEKEYELRGLRSDPYAQDAVNEADPAFADEHPNGTHWKDAQDKWCFATFLRWDGERIVDVDRSDDEWDGLWFFAGVRK